MLVGTFLAFDKHLNVILSECEEYRIRRKGKLIINIIGNVDIETKRTVGMIVVRGDNIVSLSAEAPPHQPVKSKSYLNLGKKNRYIITWARQSVTNYKSRLSAIDWSYIRNSYTWFDGNVKGCWITLSIYYASRRNDATSLIIRITSKSTTAMINNMDSEIPFEGGMGFSEALTGLKISILNE